LTDPQTRHKRGLIAVVVLAHIFFTILALIVLKTGDEEPEKALAAKETLTVIPMRIRLRTEPNARAAVVATATSGETVQLVEDQGAWVRVQSGDGLEGWAERANLERTSERKKRLARFAAIRRLPILEGVTSTRAQLFAGPGIFYPLIGEVPAGTAVKVYTRDHDFYAVDYRDVIAYADVDAIDVSASGSSQLTVDTSPPATDTSSTGGPPPETETVAEAPPPPPTIAPPDASLIDRAGVYAAVPPGGTQPEEIDRVVPRYPPNARRANVSGAVVIRGIVRRDGTIDEVEIIKDLPYGLGDAAREAVRRWRFRPATHQGEPIDVYYTVTVNFRLQ
jgi:TonB family protein